MKKRNILLCLAVLILSSSVYAKMAIKGYWDENGDYRYRAVVSTKNRVVHFPFGLEYERRGGYEVLNRGYHNLLDINRNKRLYDKYHSNETKKSYAKKMKTEKTKNSKKPLLFLASYQNYYSYHLGSRLLYD